ncbi:MAG: PEP-CTERM sorting domain-containing protein [Planctomycetaceae bacterium]|nr:PEP-CTERM sorting domain-containing protein [Planctomycetaceae bacterium]
MKKMAWAFIATATLVLAAGTAANAAYSYGYVWDRSADFALAPITNPDNDSQGNAVWRCAYSTGGSFTYQSGAKWYQQTGTALIWDSSWFGGGAVWARANDKTPVAWGSAMVYASQSGVSASYAPLVQWINPAGNGTVVEINGTLTRSTTVGTSNYDFAAVWYDASANTYTAVAPGSVASTLYSTTSIFTFNAVTLTLDAGDFIQFGIKPHAPAGGDYITMEDNITITYIPEPATVVLLSAGTVAMLRRRRA